MFRTLAPTVHLTSMTGGQATAHSNVWDSLLTVLAALALLCVFLVVLTFLEPGDAIERPPSRREMRRPLRRPNLGTPQADASVALQRGEPAAEHRVRPRSLR